MQRFLLLPQLEAQPLSQVLTVSQALHVLTGAQVLAAAQPLSHAGAHDETGSLQPPQEALPQLPQLGSEYVTGAALQLPHELYEGVAHELYEGVAHELAPPQARLARKLRKCLMPASLTGAKMVVAATTAARARMDLMDLS